MEFCSPCTSARSWSGETLLTSPVLVYIQQYTTLGAHVDVLPPACCKQWGAQPDSALLFLQDMDVETLMQEIKQWGPQDQNQAPPGAAPVNEPESQTPRRVSPERNEEQVPSPVRSITPAHSPVQDDGATSSSDKASFKRCACFDLHERRMHLAQGASL